MVDWYGSECWCLQQGDERNILVAEIGLLMSIMRVTRKDIRLRNKVIREKLHQKATTVEEMKKRRLKRFGHITRMDDTRLPSRASRV